ncbi:hypothetical protein M438DRAFT_279907 [Aureobasidium pullulans EXF-150]|uniref:Uncharacterized protein n=1 Tax=Aureobasidium pullulans EXF-150 TaxID=1043002 RepID=A0A074X7G5_AURPU|nr:uncharacterized protein M438DRAFT_279907 [Aureobasidium pullulans EXF-150]KEQ81328.1 hypothetical protein M438DRAFT_279907 [Aureobasidium pullulans EXF-150]
MNIQNVGETEDDPLGQWPAKYMMGPPSMAPDWHPLLEKWGLQVLKKAGFINYSLHIHPVFRKAMWKDLEDEDYKVIEPALLIASAYLDDEITLTYFHAMAAGPEEMGTFSDDVLGECNIATIPETLAREKQIEAYAKIRKMCDFTTWKFESVHRMSKSHCTGMMKPLFQTETDSMTPPDTISNTHQSEIYLSDQFGPQLLLYEQQAGAGNRTYDTLQRAAGIPPNKMITILAEGVLARTTVTLAITILHEFVHAFGKAYFPKPVLDHPFEPWFPGKRTNEQGCSFEEFVFGGMIKSLNIWVPPMSLGWDGWQNISPAFGLWFDENEDQWFVHDPAGAQAIMNDYLPVDRSRPKKLWPIPQEWCQRLLTDGMWNDQVTRFGQRAYKLPRLEYWATYRWQRGGPGVWKTGQERWNAVPRDPVSDTAPTWL